MNAETAARIALLVLVCGLAALVFAVCWRGLVRGQVSLGFGNEPIVRTRSPVRYWSVIGFGMLAPVFTLLALLTYLVQVGIR